MKSSTEDRDLIILTFQLPKALAIRARILASELNVSRSEFVRQALISEIERRQAAEKKEGVYA